MPNDNRKPKVLVIDDDESICQLIIDLLENEEVDVTSAIDGLRGMRLFRQNPADLVITDIVMPGMEGLEIIRDLKKNYPDTEIIVISGASGEYIDHAKVFGARHIFVKPFDVKTLLSTVRKILEDIKVKRQS
ncbi:MAG: response regulator [Candidatus Marinimicrobia bacterium]|nr:response regulator [Candidatus Neomarinimicrobiota bacterium]